MNKNSRKLTLEDIGKLAGVSRATVSRVINNYPHITPEVRERVQRVIKETGYQPNKIAQSLASNKTGMIGLVIPHDANAVMVNPYFGKLIESMTRATNQNELTLALFLFHSMEEEARIARSILNNNLVDGIIITADRKQNSFARQMMQHDIPMVYIGQPEKGVNVSFVNVDNIGGGYLATEHLIKRNRKRIATIMVNHNTAGEDRFEGYRRALKDHNIPMDPALIVEGDFSQESGYKSMRTLLGQLPDAVFVASDLMAIGAQRAIREAGHQIPDDIAMVGFDDLPQTVYPEVALTTIRQPVDQLGYQALDMLQNCISGKANYIETRVLPIELVVRST